MEIEDVVDLNDLLDYVNEHMVDDAMAAQFTRVLQMTLMKFNGRYLRELYSTRGLMEVPEEYRQPGDPAQWESREIILHISEFENPGFRFALDSKGFIQYCVVRDPAEPIDRLGAPPGATLH